MFPKVLSILLEISLNALDAVLGHSIFLLLVFLKFLERNGSFTPKIRSKDPDCCFCLFVCYIGPN